MPSFALVRFDYTTMSIGIEFAHSHLLRSEDIVFSILKQDCEFYSLQVWADKGKGVAQWADMLLKPEFFKLTVAPACLKRDVATLKRLGQVETLTPEQIWFTAYAGATIFSQRDKDSPDADQTQEDDDDGDE